MIGASGMKKLMTGKGKHQQNISKNVFNGLNHGFDGDNKLEFTVLAEY